MLLLLISKIDQNALGIKGIAEGFELPGSIKQYPQSRIFKILSMKLAVSPNLDEGSEVLRECNEESKIEILNDTKTLILDIAEIKVHSVQMHIQKPNEIGNNVNHVDLTFEDEKKEMEDKLIISLPEVTPKGTILQLFINYSAGYNKKTGTFGLPRSGVHFIKSPKLDNLSKYIQVWTQGQTTESRYWFPCLDDPLSKFPREIHVTIPEEYELVSNGVMIKKIEHFSGNGKKIEWIWEEHNPISTYLTSIVIGKFKKKTVNHSRSIHNSNNDSVELNYYWPKEIEERKYDPMLTYGDTPNIFSFLESYLDTQYPYNKYSQVAVKDFDFGGMENASCTTLPDDLFHDDEALPNYTFDDEVVVHELAHQWFGDLVTCKDWSHIWLNEGFATYCESLYLDKEYIEGKTNRVNRNEFYYYVLSKIFDVYIDETLQYSRPLVTKIYKHPDDMFDSHSYQKGGSILHMLRNILGESDFQTSLNKYLNVYANRNVETDDLRKIMEEVSGISLERFFDQWVYRKGHPIINLEITLGDSELNVSIRQILESTYDELVKRDILINDNSTVEPLISENEIFAFPIEIKLFFSNSEPQTYTIRVDKNDQTETIKLEKGYENNLQYISVDPELKILKEIRSLRLIDEVNRSKDKMTSSSNLCNQIGKGETVIERIEALRLLKNEKPAKETIDLICDRVHKEPFYGVVIECLSTLANYVINENINDKEIKRYIYERMKSPILDSLENNKKTYDKRVLASLILSYSQLKGQHSKQDIELVKQFVNNDNWFIARSAIASLGKITSTLQIENEKGKENGIKDFISDEKKLEIIEFLKSIINKEADIDSLAKKSFRNLHARGAINGLQNFSSDSNEKIILDIAGFLTSCTTSGKEYLIRRDSVFALGNFLRYKIKEDENETEKFNEEIFGQFIDVIRSPRFGLQTAVCQSLVKKLPDTPDENTIKILEQLVWIAEHDTDGSVRREAEVSINEIRKKMREWTDQPLILESRVRQEREKSHENIMKVRRDRLDLY